MSHWAFRRALEVTGVQLVILPDHYWSANMLDGAHGPTWIAVSPRAEHPRIVALRELAHVVLGHDYRDPAREAIVAEHAALLIMDVLDPESHDRPETQEMFARLELELEVGGDKTPDESNRTDLAMSRILNAGIGIDSFDTRFV